jgi:hypothetical protein
MRLQKISAGVSKSNPDDCWTFGRNASVNVQQGRVENGHRSDDDDQDQLVAVKPVRQHTCNQINFNSFI